MKDAFGVEIQVGDTVAFNPPYYKGLVKGVVLYFSLNNTVRVSYDIMLKDQASVYPFDVVVDLSKR